MTLRSYMRVLSAAIALLFVAVGCKDSDEEIPPPSEKYTFDIAVSDIRVADAVVTVTPSDALATYYCSVVKKADFDKLGSDEAYLDDDIDYLKAQAEKKQLTFKAYLETVIATGSEPIKFVTLEPSTDYYAYVYGITPEGRVTSDLKKTPFTTATPEPTELTFEFKVENITMTAADIAVIPSDDEAPYYFDVIAAAAYEGMSEDEILADVLDAIIPAYLTQGPDGYPAEMFEGMLALKPGTEYYVYAIGYDAEKEEPTSELQMYKFSTTAPTGEAPDLTFSARAGDADGNNTSTMIYCTAVSEAAVSAKMACLPKQIVDDFIGQGASLENIADANGQDVKSEDIAALNAKGGLGLTLAGDAPAEAMNKSLQQVQGALDRKPEKKVDLGGGKKDKDESSDEGGSGKGKQVIIHKLLVPVDLKKIKDLQQLLALLQEVEDYAAANEDGEPGDDEDAVPAPA